MKRILIKIAVLAVVFLGSAYAFSVILNRDDFQSTKPVDEPSLPVLSIRYDGAEINRMFGYVDRMDERSLRDTVTLLPFDRSLSLSITPYESAVKTVSYCVSSFDGTVIENGQIKSLLPSGSALNADFRLENPITMGQEYSLRFEVTLENGDLCYYYTRVVQRNGQNLRWYLDYADAFYRNCLQDNITDDMRSQLEPVTSESNSSLHFVNIHSDEDQLTWGGLHPALVTRAVPKILEVNETTVSIGQDYIVSAVNEDGNTEYYTVSEYYRMRKAQDFVVLLDYERITDQCFDPMLPVLNETGINLGITGKDLTYKVNEQGDIVVFTLAGELWEYNRTAGKASRLFTFRGDEHTDPRSENQEYRIRVSSLSEDGDVVFIVYGHMNSGTHEGSNGLVIYRYDQAENKAREVLYIPSDQGIQMLERSISRLAYLNENEQFFACYGDSISSIQLSDLSSFFIQEELEWDTFAVSDSQTLVAWTVQENGRNTYVNELDLNTGNTLQITAPENEQIVSLGFMGEDLVYGLYRESDAYTDETGTRSEPMYRLCLMNAEGGIEKDFHENGTWISSVTREDSMLNLSCFTYEDGERRPVSEQHIVYYEIEQEENVSIRLSVSDRRGTEVSIVFTANERTNGLLTLHCRYSSGDEAPQAELMRREADGEYYSVYAKGGLYGIYERLNQAVEIADAEVGVVLNRAQQYVWERGNYQETMILEPEQLPAGVLSAPIEESALQKAVGERYSVWNLSGCSLASLKYQISSGYPVCAKWSDTENVLILGYDTYENIWIYDRKEKQPKAVAFEEAQENCSKYGNIFISYHI